MRVLALLVLGACYNLPARPSDADGGGGEPGNDSGPGDAMDGQCVDDDFDLPASRECGDWAQQFGFGLTLSRIGRLSGAHTSGVATLTCTSAYFDFVAGARIEIVSIPTETNGSLGMKVETSTGEWLSFTIEGGSTPTVETLDHDGISTQDTHSGTPYFRIVPDSSKEMLVVERSDDNTSWMAVAAGLRIPTGVEKARVQLQMTFDQGDPAGTASFDNFKTCP